MPKSHKYMAMPSAAINDIQGGTTGIGIHAGVMAGTILVALKTYAGVDVRDGKLNINPHLPKHWRSIKSNLGLQENKFEIEISLNEVKVKYEGKEEKLKFWVNSEEKESTNNQEVAVSL